jgi:3',5'-cyclic AMP phosphodiesterase CpdA
MTSIASQMLLAQLSDLHISTPDTAIGRFLHPVERLHSAIDILNDLDRPLDALVITGDLVDTGSAEEYRLLRTELDRCRFDWYVLSGNHDLPEGFATQFGDRPGVESGPPFQWVVDRHPLRLIGLDTTLADRNDGALDAERLDWLSNTLAAAPDHPTVVAMHHPPVATGMWWMEYTGLDGATDLKRIVADNPQVVRVICGHVHRDVSTTWGTTVVSSAKSLVFQSGLGLSEESVARLHDTPLSAPIFAWDGVDLTAFQVELEAPRMSMDMADLVDDWPAYVAAVRSGGPVHR